MSSLKPIQERVLALIGAGFTATSAARQVGVHRHTVANWLQSEEFQAGLEDARATKQLLYWDQAEALAGKALANLSTLMDDPKVPPSVRIRATIATLEHARAFLPIEPGVVFSDTEPAPIETSLEANPEDGQGQPTDEDAAIGFTRPNRVS